MDDAKKEMLLVLRAQTGDRAALDELLRSIQAPLYRYIFRLTAGKELAEDILQDVFLIIYRKIGWLDAPEVFRAWAYRIASREAFRHLKKEKKWSDQVRDEEILGAIPAVDGKTTYEPELMEKIPAFLSEVSPASRAVLTLHYLNEMSLSEVAEILGITTGTAKSRLAYGLQTMRKLIKKEK